MVDSDDFFAHNSYSKAEDQCRKFRKNLLVDFQSLIGKIFRAQIRVR